jgi:hypothetical protein
MSWCSRSLNSLLYPLEAQGAGAVVQSGAEAQANFRTYRYHYTRPSYFEAARRGARDPVLRVPGLALTLYELTTPYA